MHPLGAYISRTRTIRYAMARPYLHIKWKLIGNTIMLAKITSFIVILFFSSTAFAQEGEGAAAKQFIVGLGDQVVSIFEKYDEDNIKKREDALNSLFAKSIDAAWMGKFVMGKYWRKASGAQQEKFQKLYKEFLFIN